MDIVGVVPSVVSLFVEKCRVSCVHISHGKAMHLSKKEIEAKAIPLRAKEIYLI